MYEYFVNVWLWLSLRDCSDMYEYMTCVCSIGVHCGSMYSYTCETDWRWWRWLWACDCDDDCSFAGVEALRKHHQGSARRHERSVLVLTWMRRTPAAWFLSETGVDCSRRTAPPAHTRLCDTAVELTEFGLFIHVHKCRAIIVLTVVISQCDVDRCCVFDATVMRSWCRCRLSRWREHTYHQQAFWTLTSWISCRHPRTLTCSSGNLLCY